MTAPRINGAVDGHLHLYEAASRDRPRALEPHPWWPDANPAEAALPAIAEHGVELAVQVTPALEGWSNEYSFDAARAHSGRVHVFARVDPRAIDDRGSLRSLMARDHAAGLRFTLHLPGTSTLLADGAFEPLWEVAASDRIPVALYAPGQLEHVARALERRPELRIVVDHGAVAVHPGWEGDRFADVPWLCEIAAYPNAHVKVSALCEASDEEYPFRDVHDLLGQLREWFGAGRLIWGSDYPNVLKKCSYAEALTYLSEAQVFTAPELSEVLGGTMRRLLRASRVDDHAKGRTGDELTT